jgi:hypothetical protein
MNDAALTRRPFLVTLLALIFLGLVVSGWVRLEQAIQHGALLVSFGGAGLPVYVGISGFIWGAIGLPVIWALWRRATWGYLGVWMGALAYPLLYWLDHFFASHSPVGLANWIFAAGMSIAWLLFVWFTISRPGMHAYLRHTRAD